MPVEIITKQDLTEFRNQLLHDLQSLINTKTPQPKQWLKSSEVRKLLGISPGTLQNLRINGTLKYNRIGSIIYYNYQQIQDILQQTQTN